MLSFPRRLERLLRRHGADVAVFMIDNCRVSLTDL
jgi:hypothetical protein